MSLACNDLDVVAECWPADEVEPGNAVTDPLLGVLEPATDEEEDHDEHWAADECAYLRSRRTTDRRAFRRRGGRAG
jgi:hypothetical protein